MYRHSTTGFLEQDHSARSTVNRQRQKLIQSAKAAQSHASPAVTREAAPPKPVSTADKAQLGAFAYQNHPKTPSTTTNEENIKQSHRDSIETSGVIPAPRSSRKALFSRDCPQTPTPKLPLKELVRFREDDQQPSAGVASDHSPEERITWQLSPRGTPTTTQITPATKRQKGAKRAKSSSPIGSPWITPSSKRNQQQQSSAPKTPYADPANDVWQRYSSTSSNTRPPNPPGVPQRLFTAEKRNSLNLSPLGLRRSYTCGPDWAPVRLKRRKTSSAETESPDTGEVLGNISEDIEPPEEPIFPFTSREDKSKLSRVSMLLEKVHEKLAKSLTPPENQSSSPPCLGRGCDIPSSPSRNATSRRAHQGPCSNVNHKPDVWSNDDYDEFDDDIDLDILEKAEEEALALTQKQQQKQRGVKRQPVVAVAREGHTIPYGHSDFDEFDFGDEDNTLDDIDVDTLVPQTDTVASQLSVTSSTAAEVVKEFGDIDFGDWDDEDLDCAVRCDTDSRQFSSNGLKADIISGALQRFVILETSGMTWEYQGERRLQKILKLQDEKSLAERVIYLRDEWYNVNAENGDVIHVIGKTNIIDRKSGMVIVNPDILISSTTVADSFGCKRRAVLQDRVKATAIISRPLVYGSILHELFQKALVSNDFSDKFLCHAIDLLLLQHIQSLYMLKEEVPVAKDYLKSKVALIQRWAKLFISAIPKAEARASDHRGRERPNLCINKVLDIEEHVWSPVYGLKGNIDATVQATIRDLKSERTLTVPFELKTGRNSSSPMHRAQTMIYTLLLKDRYDVDIFYGLLYYMETSEVIRIPSIREELCSMIVARNELAWYAKNRDQLPQMLKSHACNACFAKDTCFIYHKGLEDGNIESGAAETQFRLVTSHMNDAHKRFLKHWDQLLSREESDMNRFRKELWTMTSSEREAKGRCFGNLVVIPESIIVAEEGSRVHRFTYQLRRTGDAPPVSFLDSQIGINDPIVISDERGHFALAVGFVVTICRTTITVSVDRRLHNARIREKGFDSADNQTFAGIMKVGYGDQSPPQNAPILLRLDKDELVGGMALVRNNLVQLLSNKYSDRLRELIIERRRPVFRKGHSAYPKDEGNAQFNWDQRAAIEKVMTANDYALILGMPGTGKTTTIGHIIRSLVSQGKSVLLTSYTHTAVDNILLKIKNDGISTLRLGNKTKIHPDVKEFALLAEVPRTSFKEINEAFMLPKVVATTCLGIDHNIFNERIFDYCIIDEASQITLPVCVGPLRMAKKFILVGDHHQLPPLVRNQAAKEGGLDISLFKLLSDAHPEAVVCLEHQYRMCEEIMSLSNMLIYDGRLKCGNEAIARRTLTLPNPQGLLKLHLGADGAGAVQTCDGRQCWITDLLDQKIKVSFVNTDKVPALEIKKSDRIDNPVEAQLAFQLVESLIEAGVDSSSIGVISVYRSQVKAMQYLLRDRPAVEIHTTDKFQGRDKECIIISLVRSNTEGNIGDLLKDWRRVNVAFTRARSKLLILGSRSTLFNNKLLRKFVDLMEESHWTYTLPTNAHRLHTGTLQFQTSGSPPRLPRVHDENSPRSTSRVTKTGTVKGKALFANRPVLKDIANDIGIF